MNAKDYLNSPLHLLRRVLLANRRALGDACADLGISDAQVDVLMRLWHADGLEQRMLQESMRVSSATCTGVTDSLVANDLVRREVSPDDARVKRLYLTEKGRALESRMGDRVMAVQEQLLDGFTPAERLMLRDWLERMLANLASFDDCKLTAVARVTPVPEQH
jgi:DNA-binding MarR family transcriptional regulator